MVIVTRYARITWLWVFGLPPLLAIAGCGEERLREFLGLYTPRERYEHVLRESGLDQTALGRDWFAAATAALGDPIQIESPYREESYLDPREAVAFGYSVPLRRGQRIEVEFESLADTSYQVFIDLFLTRDSDSSPRHITTADSLERKLDHLARRDGDYLIRIQPELLRGGRYTISIVVLPSLVFPVLGGDSLDIGSWYGDPRDGGRRRHEGLDIFAARWTPVLAAADGVVRSTRSNGMGGNVVWLRDKYDRNHYYAHLQEQAVRRGDRVQVGDTIGFVGNSGNARTTPPHLHFGVYSRGTFDPWPALQRRRTVPADFSGDRDLIGEVVRVNRDVARFRELPSTRSSVLAELPMHTPLRVEAGAGDWYRVTTPDGILGFVSTSLTEPADSAVRREVVDDGAALLTEPVATAVAVDRIAAGTEVPVLGAFRDFLFVQGPSGRMGWLAPN
jgi:murein DD-endopeptidase MepM/ murein hydrolase activator NlpD